MPRRKAKTPLNVRKKTSELIHEGDTPEQAYAIAHSMRRRGRLGPQGGLKGTRRGKRITTAGGKRVTLRGERFRRYMKGR